MKAIKILNITLLTLFLSAMPLLALARGGGGGSSGGGGGGGGGSFSGGSGSSTCHAFKDCPVQMSLYLIIAISLGIFTLVATIRKRRADAARKAGIIATADSARDQAAQNDPHWDKAQLDTFIRATFYEFQRAWGAIDVPALEKILTPEMHKRIALELAVLNNEGRRNPTEIKEIVEASIISVNDDSDNAKDWFSVLFTAKADDKLVQVDSNKVIFEDTSSFTETWDFTRDGDSWRLSAIHQATEDASSLIPSIQAFASKNGFFYNPDFGWLMLPNKGVLFAESRFGNTDINNHVIGYFRDKIVEFYTMDVWKDKNNNSKESYLVAQAILPIQHNDILIRRKHLLQFTPSGMVKHELESNEFIKEFQVCSDPQDNMETFELLTPNFMEMIMKLPFELTIEVVGNTLYLSTKQKPPTVEAIFNAVKSATSSQTEMMPRELMGDVDYEKMLSILSYAFDEMKM